MIVAELASRQTRYSARISSNSATVVSRRTHAAIEGVAGSEAARIPGRDFAEHAAAVGFAEEFHHPREVPAHDLARVLRNAGPAVAGPVSRKRRVCWKIHGL